MVEVVFSSHASAPSHVHGYEPLVHQGMLFAIVIMITRNHETSRVTVYDVIYKAIITAAEHEAGELVKVRVAAIALPVCNNMGKPGQTGAFLPFVSYTRLHCCTVCCAYSYASGATVLTALGLHSGTYWGQKSN